MNRNDTIELILVHAIAQGRYSSFYLSLLQSMSTDALDEELERFEELAMFTSTLPSKTFFADSKKPTGFLPK